MISILIVNYFSSYLTQKAVESVLNEDESLEVFVVDNTATNDERTLLKKLLPDGIHLILNEWNEGFAKACNRAFALSKGDWIFLINPDAYVIPPCLSILKNILENNPQAGAVGPLTFWDNSMTYCFPRSLSPSPIRDFVASLSQCLPFLRYMYSFSEREQNLKLWKATSPMKVQNLSGGTAMLRRSAIKQVGGLFDERFFLYYEDSDLFSRLRKSGYQLFIAPAAKAVHNHKYTKLKLDVMAQTRALYYNKHFRRYFFYDFLTRLLRPHQRGKYIDFGTWNTPPLFRVPSALKKNFLFEWSPTPLFVPSVGYFGRGETLYFSDEIWNALDSGNYFSRFTDAEKLLYSNKILHWRKI
jgi:GT2 family glycosyltransferase